MERTEERTDSRNGVRTRELKTRIGRLTLNVPRHRNQPFRTMLFENYPRSEQSLLTTMAVMVLEGVSTRKIARITEELCGTSFSKSAVSEVCKSLDTYVNEFRNRPLTDSYPFLTVDATYFKVRENHRVTARALMIAYAVNSKGLREVVGFKAYPNESTETWTDFLSGLRQRGLTDPRMIIPDSALAAVSVSLCQKHYCKSSGEVPGRTKLRTDRNVQLQNNRRGQKKAGPDSL